jgi:8-oxo-dGTP pyrophosphatase MutT (NUDIX family)
LPSRDDAFTVPSIAARLRRASPLELTHGSRQAAVATILRDTPGGAEVLLIRRAEREGDPWSGHMAFPGGRRDAQDPDLYATAVRETREEVGLDLTTHGALLGRLADLPAIARGLRADLVIRPFVFALEREATLAFDAAEVAEALWTPLAALARGEGAGVVHYRIEGREIELPCWHVGGRVVWGLTHRMLVSLFELIGDDKA